MRKFLLPSLLVLLATATLARAAQPNLILFLANAELTGFESYHLKSDSREATDLKSAEPQRFAALREQLLKHNAAVEAEGPDWWKTLSPNGSRARGDDAPAT